MKFFGLMRRICVAGILVALMMLSLGCEKTEVDVDGNGIGGGEGAVVVDGIPTFNLPVTISRQPNMQFFAQALEFSRLDLLIGEPTAAFTVTVPTDDAFNALSEQRRSELLNDQREMRNLLLRHIAPVVRNSDEIGNGIEMLDLSNRFVTDDLLAVRDIEATNGVVHGINTVFDASTADASTQTISEALSDDGRFSGLVAAIRLTSLGGQLSAAGANQTFFAPTNQAFFALGQDRVVELYANIEELEALLSYHLVQAPLSGDAFGGENGVQVGSVNGAPLNLNELNGQLFVNSVEIQASPIVTANGTIYVIGTVLEP